MDPYKSTYQNDYTAPDANNIQGRARDKKVSRALDNFTYTTTYRQEFCIGHSLPREPGGVDEINAECLARFIPGVAEGKRAEWSPSKSCECQMEGAMPPRGAKAAGLPTNVEKKCQCFSGEKNSRRPLKNLESKESNQREENTEKQIKRNARETHFEQKAFSGANIGWEVNNLSEDNSREEGKWWVSGRNKSSPVPTCPWFEGLRPLPKGKYGGQCPQRNQEQPGDGRIPWLRERRDERRDPDVLRLTRHPPRGEVRDVVHGEEERGARRTPVFNYPVGRRFSGSRTTRIPGPFWIRQRPDERREIDVPRRRKFESFSEIRDVVHGEGTSGVRRDDRSRLSLDFGHRRRPAGTNSGTRIPGPFWTRVRPDERREVDVPRRRKFESLSEAPFVIHGERAGRESLEDRRRRHPLDLPSLCRPRSASRIPGPFWMRQRRDERREPDVLRKRKIPQEIKVKDVIHGEEARERQRLEGRPPINLYDLPPGPSHSDPFWLLERQDERREPDFLRRKKGGRQKLESAETVHGEDFREHWYPSIDVSGPSSNLPRFFEEEDDDFSSDDESGASVYRAACRCGPPHPESGPYAMTMDSMNSMVSLSSDMEEILREPPAARVSCAPEADVSQFDQPNTFMKKLYQKYPYLYQVLRETPPEELASRVFKDRFMSTYQVDFLHMGVGREQFPAEEAEREEQYMNPDGEPEPAMIPGCTYRHSKKGDHGRKNFVFEKKEKEKEKEKEEDVPSVQVEKEEPRISEYMATVSKLGGEIIQDRLYKVAQITKNMKNQYKNM